LQDQGGGRRAAEDDLSAQVTTAWETLLTVDGVLRRLRMHKEPERNLQLVLKAARQLVPAEALIWVPQVHTLPPVTCGTTRLTHAECQGLVASVIERPDWSSAQPFLGNGAHRQLWEARFPSIRNLLLLQAADQGTTGWLLALNKPEAASFRKTDAAILSPFLSIIEMYGKSLGRFQEMKELMVGMTRSLTAAIDAKDPFTLGHSERVARIATEIARGLGMDEVERADIYLAGLLHDIGKIGIQDYILRKPGSLTKEEYEHVKQHVTIGFSILSDVRAIRNLLPGVLYHHENYDGTGYPDGLRGDAIPLLARILAVADAYDSMSSPRPYRDALPFKEVEARLQEGAGTQWDPKVVDALLRVRQVVHAIRQKGVGESLRVAMDAALPSKHSVMRSYVFI
jgi:HD-GYP domain-containing protein (c-di-GMP phosphodiesterase class II)